MNEELMAQIKAWGLQKEYVPYLERETGVILLKCRKPMTIIDGDAHGVEMAVTADGVRIWTSRLYLAMLIAKKNQFRIKKFNKEAEVLIPLDRADEFLHKMGARVKWHRKPLDEVGRQALRLHLAAIHLVSRGTFGPSRPEKVS